MLTAEWADVEDLYGLRIRSAIALVHERHAHPGSLPDIVVSRGGIVPATLETPPGDILLDFATDQRWYTLVRSETGRYLFRIYGVCDFDVSEDMREVTLRAASDMTPGMEPIMIRGSLAALQLYLRGHLVLHASAVQLVDHAVAFVGHSGMGKSTLATLMCADGAAAVITDDVLRIDMNGDGRPVTRLGTGEVRLRSGAEGLGDQFDEADTGLRISADRRRLVRPPGSATDHVPLGLIVIPHPSRDSEIVEIVRLRPKDALMAVLSFPRLMGWRDPDVLARIFTQVGWLVGGVPVVAARVPWGPPFPKDLTARLIGAIQSVLE